MIWEMRGEIMSNVEEYGYNDFDGTGFEKVLGGLVSSAMMLRSLGYSEEDIFRILEEVYETEITFPNKEKREKIRYLIDTYSDMSKVYGGDPDEAFLKILAKAHEDD